MNIEHRQVLKKNRDYLVENIKFDDLKDLLLKYKMFNKYMWYDINSMEDLLDMLPHRGPKAFQNITEIFRKAGYHKEADTLEKRVSVPDVVDTNLFYKMSSKPLGYCLIINNVTFDKFKSEDSSQPVVNRDRHGSDTDAKSLRSFFENAGFEVVVKRNLKAADMIASLKAFSKHDFDNADSLIIITLSHGDLKDNKDVIYGTDWNFIYKSQVIDCFNTENCECLRNKPKVFFFISCRGRGMDYGVPKCIPNETLDTTVVYLPVLSDIFIIHSTLPDHVSVLDNEDGSFFCQALIDVLNKNYQIHDLETIIKLVNEKLQGKVSLIYHIVQVAHIEVFGATKKVKFCKT